MLSFYASVCCASIFSQIRQKKPLGSRCLEIGYYGLFANAGTQKAEYGSRKEGRLVSAAANYTRRISGGIDPCAPIDRRPIIVLMPIIITPFDNIPVHVVKPPGIRFKNSQRGWSFYGFSLPHFETGGHRIISIVIRLIRRQASPGRKQSIRFLHDLHIPIPLPSASDTFLTPLFSATV